MEHNGSSSETTTVLYAVVWCHNMANERVRETIALCSDKGRAKEILWDCEDAIMEKMLDGYAIIDVYHDGEVSYPNKVLPRHLSSDASQNLVDEGSKNADVSSTPPSPSDTIERPVELKVEEGKPHFDIVQTILIGLLIVICIAISCVYACDGGEWIRKFDPTILAKSYASTQFASDRGGSLEFNKATACDVVDEMDAGSTFIVFFGFEDCPYCQAVSEPLYEALDEATIPVLYVDTRENPEWESNMDIDGYDDLCEKLGEYFQIDENGREHLHVPHLFFIADGEVVYDLAGFGDEFDDLTPSEFTDSLAANGKYMSEVGAGIAAIESAKRTAVG